MAPKKPKSPSELPMLLRMPEAAYQLGVSVRTVYQLVYDKKLTLVKIGKSTRVRTSEVLKLIDGRSVGTD